MVATECARFETNKIETYERSNRASISNSNSCKIVSWRRGREEISRNRDLLWRRDRLAIATTPCGQAATSQIMFNQATAGSCPFLQTQIHIPLCPSVTT